MNITAGIYKGRKIKAPDEKITRPTLSKAREGIFNTLFSLMDFEGKIFLDMFAGSGIMGLEALSRGFGEVFAIEKNHTAAKVFKDNYKSLNINPNLLIGDSLKVISKTGKIFDVIYIDPPYFGEIYEDCLESIKKNESLNKNGILILEHVVDVGWENFDFKLIKQKKYSGKSVSFLEKV